MIAILDFDWRVVDSLAEAPKNVSCLFAPDEFATAPHYRLAGCYFMAPTLLRNKE